MRVNRNEVVVETENGLVEGRRTHTKWERDIASFMGIPYAAPPVGELRWRPPQPRSNWRGVLKCLKYSNDAPQLGVHLNSFVHHFLTKQKYSFLSRKMVLGALEVMSISKRHPFLQRVVHSEDCLYLNIRTPDATLWDSDPHAQRHKLLPVIVFFHGGDFHDGSGGRRYYYASSALPACGNVVLLTFNYRLGIFGNFTHPSLTKEREAEGFARVSGNYGILDQVAVLQWVRRNISNFGGDPNNVTLCGTSAGGESVAYMMCSPLARGLFHRAIVQSPASAYDHFLRLKEPCLVFSASEDNGVHFADRLTGEDLSGDEQIAKMREIPFEVILNQYHQDAGGPQPHQLFYPVVDGVVLPKNILETFQNGEQAIVPLIIGYNRDEGSLCFPVTQSNTFIRDCLYPSPIREVGPNAYGEQDADTLIKLYDELVFLEGRRKGDEQTSWKQRGETGCYADESYLTDRVFAQKVLWLANHHALHPEAPPVYLYTFCREPQTPGQTIGAYHCAELPFLFGSKIFFETTMSQKDQMLSQSMIYYWTSFSRYGNPNGEPHDPHTLPSSCHGKHHNHPDWYQFRGTYEKENCRILLNHKITVEKLDEALVNRISIIHKSVRAMLEKLPRLRSERHILTCPIPEE